MPRDQDYFPGANDQVPILIDVGQPDRQSPHSQRYRANNNDLLLPPPHPLQPDYNTSDYLSDIEPTSQEEDKNDICMPNLKEQPQDDFDTDALEQYIQKSAEANHSPPSLRKRRLSNMFENRKYSLYGDRALHPESDDPNQYRFSFYSTAEPSTIHTRYLHEIPSKGTRLTDMLKKGCFWIDVLNPTDAEMKILCKVFRIHPLTEEDITMEEQREKCDVFYNYYFICFRSFEQDPLSPNYLQPLALYIVVLRDGVLTFHFRPTPHPHNVRRRIKQLRDYISVSPDWICYGLLDDITDSFAPLIKSIEFEVDSIDELVLILKESEQSDMLRRIGYCRKRVMSLLRLLVAKADVVKMLIKRGESTPCDATRPTLSTEVVLFLGDVQDHLLTMLQSLNHYEKISSRSHSNYLAQISIEMTQTNNEINDILSKLTALGSVLVPMNLVTGLWGMNVQVPGQMTEDLTWFSCITISILSFCIIMTSIMRYYNIV
ncbi:cora-domain-containing protein [Hesseltinella vesiculosa]|uniref:Cora-domain-containing protein n=1 Tax=Hesseltinella vesiculosa TaxID=101127 RepID=A0A1X2GYI3_9FUNG|nr:cora-domain-containing protein [Hesseltinella vesiculosa]